MRKVLGVRINMTYEEAEKRMREYNQKLIEKGVLTPIESIDFDRFIEYCEQTYEMSSTEFIVWYEANDFEGNSDMKFWYTLVKDDDE